MTENDRYMNDAYYEEEDPIDWAKYLNLFKANWKLIFKWAGVAFVVGCIVALGTPHTYKVVAKLTPESISNASASRLSSLASLVGISSSITSSDAISPLVYPELLKSNEFMADLFELPVSFVEKEDTLETSLFEYMGHHRKKSLLGAVMSFPSVFFKKEEPPISRIDPFHFTRKQEAVAKRISRCIKMEFDKKLSIISIEVIMQDPMVATQTALAVMDYLKSYITRYRTQKSIKDCEYYEILYLEAKDNYYQVLNEFSEYNDSHQGVTLMKNQIEKARLQNELDLKYDLYTATAQQLQGAKAKVQQETPVFAEIIPPTVPLHPNDSRKKTALAFGFLGLVLGYGYVLWKNREVKNQA